ncbi:myristoylated alanine-rich C-kinase substrate-like [Hyperolius riggenbachi]|uniref:myristoylated alanine-rich C-kinase substrate-like n=1 Tax=Hyperolius riggenbachi TaxID=752182 RepID=UPI0035A36F1B
MEDVESLLQMVRTEAAARGPSWVAEQMTRMAGGADGEPGGRSSARISRPPERLSPSPSPRGTRRSGSPSQGPPAPPKKKGKAAGGRAAEQPESHREEERPGTSASSDGMTGQGDAGPNEEQPHGTQGAQHTPATPAGRPQKGDTRKKGGSSTRAQKAAAQPASSQKKAQQAGSRGTGKGKQAVKTTTPETALRSQRKGSSGQPSDQGGRVATRNRPCSPSPPRRAGRGESSRGHESEVQQRRDNGGTERGRGREANRHRNVSGSARTGDTASEGSGEDEEPRRESPRVPEDRGDHPVQRVIGISPRLVWIMGHSYVSRGAQRAAVRPDGRQLGIPRATARLRWIGFPGLMWDKVLPKIRSLVTQDRAPDVLVIHAGGNDLATRTTRAITKEIKGDLLELRSTLPDTVIVWSEMVSRSKWRLARSVERVNRARKKLNREVSRCIVQHGGVAVRHLELEVDTVLFLEVDGVHLNPIGIDLWSLALEEGIQKALAVRAAQG